MTLLSTTDYAAIEALLNKYLTTAAADPSALMQLRNEIYTLSQILAVGGAVAAGGSASESTLAEISTKVDSSNSLLTSLSTEDFATQTTLATRASETTLSTVSSLLTAIGSDIDSLVAEDFASQTTLAAVETQLTTVLTRLTEVRDRLPNTASPVTITPDFLPLDNTAGSTALTGTIPAGKRFVNWICLTGTVTVEGAIFQAGTGDNKTYERESGVIYPAIAYSVSVGGNALFSYAPV